MLYRYQSHKSNRRKFKMKKVISTIVVMGLISSILINTAYAGDRNGGINPIWIPVAILSTLAAVAITQPEPVVYERRVVYEPRQAVKYEEPRHYRHARYYERDRVYGEISRHRDYR
jgi:hypothetical protein